jgi:cell division protein FtsI (penicillin-binding protein 3)
MKNILTSFKSIFSAADRDPAAAGAPRFEAGRFKLIRAVLLGAFIVISIRASIIQLFPPSEAQLKRIANKQYEQQLDIAPYRGLILDRNGHPFAISIKRPSLAVNPRVFDPSAGDLKKLSTLLDMPKSRIKEVAAKNAYFSWLKRRVDAATAAAIESLEINGLYFINEPARIYPQQHVAAHLIGSVGSDNDGLLGIERQFDKILRGERVTVSPSKDARGRTILFSSDLAAPDLPGHTLQLTIDHVIQEISDDALREGVLKAKAKSGFALVTDPHTGRILALSNYPTFDPNAIGKINIENTRNHAILDSFEPGSVTKPLVVAAAIQNNKTFPDELHNCENGLYRVGGVAFRDDHPAAMLSTTETIVRSSNVCTYKIAERLGKEGLYNAYRNFGLGGQLTLPELFPVISIGSISNPSAWKPIRFANIAFGQGLTTTGLEMAMAYGALANGGSLMKPQLIDRMISPSGEISYAAAPEAIRTAVSSETALKMRKILAKVVTSKEGTGKTAATDWYTTAGKTGTAEKVDPTTKAYSADKRIASFIGFAPAQDPYLVIYVAIDEPGLKPYYGSLWAGPVFAAIAEKSLRYLNVAPDKQPPLAVLKQNLLAPSATEQGDSRAKSKL